ncbi:neuropeptide FF receptor 1-like [Acanthaster planci]|uniref:Neuropeptide FF receptor 1-like n=1 Tax=Acanthaster planci TaxID=133434 RepID=A0A8B7XVT3_ACAPL|nr:neuropeptide FF receptor 1-like [Acanthaster planci]
MQTYTTCLKSSHAAVQKQQSHHYLPGTTALTSADLSLRCSAFGPVLRTMESNLVLRVIKTTVGLFGIVGNGLVCAVIYKIPFMHTLTNALIFNQASVDLLGSVVLLLASNIPVPNRLSSTLADWLLCRVWIGNLFLWGAFNASTFNLLSVTMERFLAIVFPLRHTQFFNRRLVIILTIGSWVLGISLQGAYIAVVQGFIDGKCFFESSPRSRFIGAAFVENIL